MATSSIGAGLDYATVTLWEADTDNELTEIETGEIAQEEI